MWIRKSYGNKYSNNKTIIDGIKFDSKKEATRYSQLKLLERAKEINNLTIQPKYELQEHFRDNTGVMQKAITYTADFSYIYKDKVYVEDVKGMKTDVYKIKKKLFLKKYPFVIFKET